MNDPGQLGPYRIERRLGRGGMGVVYLASDPRLGRSVAVKVLPTTADAQALARFLREAKTVAALQHPHIAVLLDVGAEAGISYLVMERLDGESLDLALARGPLAWKEAVRLGEQLASALAHAHGLGVLHRDIKPGNVMLTAGRGAVLLDFGVAHRAAPPPAELEHTETMQPVTREGALVGTLAYMSPEQLQSLPLDGRSDLFQLGVVLYESVAGVHPFGGQTNVDVMHAILRSAPRPLHETGRAPAELSRIVAKLLEKDPEYRYPDARDLLVDLRSLERSSSAWSAPTLETDRTALERRRRLTLPLGLGLATLGVAIGLGAARLLEPPAAPVPRRIVPFSHGEGSDSAPSLSPDGKSLVFASDRGGNPELWIGLVAGGPPVRITDTPEAESDPSWSPDGSRVVFRRSRLGENASDLYVMPALGGPARRLVEHAGDPAWSPDGRFIAYADVAHGWVRIAKVAADAAGTPAPVTEVEPGYFHRSPSFSPDGRFIFYNRSPGGLAGELRRVPADGGASVPITDDPEGTVNLSATPTPDGRFIVHASDRGGALNLWRVPVAGGTPQRITSGPGQDLDPSVSADGRRIAYVNSPTASRLLWTPIAGGAASDLLLLAGSEAWAPDVSPDGRQVAFALKTPGSPWRMSLLEKDGALRFVLDGLPDVYWARFDASGATLVFDARLPGGSRVGRVNVDGTELRWLTTPAESAGYPDLSPDGAWLAYTHTHAQVSDVVVRPLAGGPERVRISAATLPRFAGDGRRLAFARSRSYAGGVGVVTLDGGEPQWLTASGTWPTWLPDGRLAYADVGPEGSQRAFAIAVSGGTPQPLGGYRWRGGHFPFVTRDGARLLTTDDASQRTTIWIADF